MKKWFAIVVLAVCSISSFGQHKHKYYVTGYASLDIGRDCTHPALVIYGRDRMDALIKLGISPFSGGVTVWTAAEYAQMRREIGKSFDDSCKQAAQTKKARAEAQP